MADALPPPDSNSLDRSTVATPSLIARPSSWVPAGNGRAHRRRSRCSSARRGAPSSPPSRRPSSPGPRGGAGRGRSCRGRLVVEVRSDDGRPLGRRTGSGQAWPTGRSDGGGDPDGGDDGSGVRSGDPWATEVPASAPPGGTVPAEPLVAQAASRMVSALGAAIEVIGFIAVTPGGLGSESNHRLPRSQRRSPPRNDPVTGRRSSIRRPAAVAVRAPGARRRGARRARPRSRAPARCCRHGATDRPCRTARRSGSSRSAATPGPRSSTAIDDRLIASPRG